MANNQFESTPAASVSLACCQSLCDLLRELPLPSAAHAHNACLSSRVVNHQNLVNAQLESALSHAKQQLAELVFTAETTPTTSAAMSPLALQLSLKGLFGSLAAQQNNSAIYESNSLETIEPSLKTSLGFDDSLKLIDDCLQNDTDVKYFANDTQEDYSSLGDRVKSRRQHNNSETTHRRHEDTVVATPQPVVNNVVDDDRSHDRRHDDRRSEKKEKKAKERKDRDRERDREKSYLNHNDLQSKDSSASFETIVSRLMSDSVDRDDDSDDNDDRNDLSFDLRIDSRQLNHLMSLSSKLKHSNKAKEMESKLGSKLTSFLSLLTNKMIVWFSKFKETEDVTTGDDRESSDDNIYWQQLINASKMSLNLMTSRGMSSRVVLFEELLEIVINFLSFNLNSRTHVTSKSPSKSKKNQLMTTCATKRQVAHWTELLALLSEYLSRNKGLNDSLVLMVTRSSMSALFLNASELQLVAIQLLTHVFRNYQKHRNSLLEDLLNQFHRIPTLKSPKGANQSALTRLLASLTTCLFSADERLTKEGVAKQLTECLAIISAFLASFVKRCLSSSSSVSSSDVDLKALFDAFLSDLLNSLHSPQSISSLLLIQILTKLLVTNLAQTNKSATLQLKLNSVEFLANICAKFGKLLSEKNQIEEESIKTVNQLLGDDDTRRQLSQRLEDVLKLLNRFFVSEKLLNEKVILCALWSKEPRVTEVCDAFFSIFSNNKTTDDDSDDDSIDATTASLLIKSLELSVFSTVSRLFDASLSHVTSSLSLTTNTTLRSRAMKSLSQILTNCTLERSTQLLRRNDLQVAMRSALLDASTSVREATVDLIGRFVLQSKSLELCSKYADLIGERVLDTGVSVRKRVIKILRDICVQFPDLDKCGEIQLKIIKRANDEGEGIRKLVLETVRDLWFKHVTPADVRPRVASLLHVIRVMLQQEGHIDALSVLIEQILKGDDALAAAQLIADHVVAHVLVDASSGRERALENLAAMTLVALLSSMCAQLLTKHVDSLQSLLSLSCDSLVDIHLQKKLIQSLERILRKASNPSPALLCRLEEDLCKQILQSSALILPNCVKCLSVVIEEHTRNHKLAHDLFHKFQTLVLGGHSEVSLNRPKLLRAVYSLGLFLKHFPQKKSLETKDAIIDAILTLIDRHHVLNGQCEPDLVTCCLTSLGFIVEADPRVCLRPRVVTLYSRVLEGADEPLCKQVLQNFCNYLSESMASDEELNKQIEWQKESLKQMTSDDDIDSNSIQSQVIQQYLPLLLNSALSRSQSIRRVACNVVHVIQTGGHVHPLQLVPHLIAMTTDDDTTIRSRADHVLHEIERKFHGFVAMKAKAGIDLAQQLCSRLRCRGFRLLDDSSGDVTSRLATLYHVICTNRQSRRGFVQQLLRGFEVTTADDMCDDDDSDDTNDATTDRTQLMFEMVLFFPFSVCDEVLYILQQLECIQSVNSAHCSALFKDLFGFQTEEEMDDKFDDNYDAFAAEVRDERGELVLCRTQQIRRVYVCLRKVFLVCFLRRLLKEFYLLKDDKIMEYSPNEPKVWEKPIHRRHIETAHLAECLLRANPSPSLRNSSVTVDQLLEEFQRFKSVSLTSNDNKVPQQYLQNKLFAPTPKKAPPVTMETRLEPAVTAVSDLNEEQRKRLLESIRKTSCQVALVDITREDPSLLQSKRKKSEAEMNKEKKKAKRKRVRVEDSDEDSETSGAESDPDFR